MAGAASLRSAAPLEICWEFGEILRNVSPGSKNLAFVVSVPCVLQLVPILLQLPVIVLEFLELVISVKFTKY